MGALTGFCLFLQPRPQSQGIMTHITAGFSDVGYNYRLSIIDSVEEHQLALYLPEAQVCADGR